MVERRRLLLVLAGLAAVVLIVGPVLGANPSAKPEKVQKGPEIPRTLTGVVTSTTDAKGRASFAMTVDGVTWELSTGPKWYWGNNNPLAAYVGKTVVVTGTYRTGGTALDVMTVDGKALRAAGKPPWAGGPKAVGSAHPGWKAGKPGNGHGREHAPGQNKDKSQTAD